MRDDRSKQAFARPLAQHNLAQIGRTGPCRLAGTGQQHAAKHHNSSHDTGGAQVESDFRGHSFNSFLI